MLSKGVLSARLVNLMYV
ncbi:hypothetical protein M9Y22_19365 [Escherichia coli]|nr:hypothetical protein [Escherichia coli]